MTYQIATIAAVTGFLVCIVAALLLALGSSSNKYDA